MLDAAFGDLAYRPMPNLDRKEKRGRASNQQRAIPAATLQSKAQDQAGGEGTALSIARSRGSKAFIAIRDYRGIPDGGRARRGGYGQRNAG